ncbi:MarR family winged helix-turn-helix transcriptional regulator [Lacrimispora defluvii]|uniref:MarR family transcriptional regulator n=1 Tax=Lacrimispora defluvii TaxID=2719233 RepID=A0ABX1VXZ8_9FIRM|nr:MarR family transcriptional regulator [Lacrimispora defluvii]NNJ33318.1 MarR family transcriptional regulator [Lacrimispora defluvii]
MGNEPMNLMMLNSKIYRNTQSYLDKVLKQYDLSSGSFRYLFIMEQNEGLCQSRISELIGHDKAMSARTISRLTEVGYVVKIEDQLDSRAYKLYLTDKARLILPQIRKEIDKLIELITGDLTAEEKEITLSSLVKILNKALELNT